MNKQELEKMFDDVYFTAKSVLLADESVKTVEEWKKYHKDFIFKTVIPEVLKSALPKTKSGIPFQAEAFDVGFKFAIDRTHMKAKELYGVEL